MVATGRGMGIGVFVTSTPALVIAGHVDRVVADAVPRDDAQLVIAGGDHGGRRPRHVHVQRVVATAVRGRELAHGLGQVLPLDARRVVEDVECLAAERGFAA
jgi:hypothetical protein